MHLIKCRIIQACLLLTKQSFKVGKKMLLVVFHSSLFVVVYWVTRSTRTFSLHCQSNFNYKRACYEEMSTNVWAEIAELNSSLLKTTCFSSVPRTCLIPSQQNDKNWVYIRKIYKVTDWHLDLPAVASEWCQKSGNKVQLNSRCKKKECVSLSWQYNLFCLFKIFING